jgi:hypothetical protein
MPWSRRFDDPIVLPKGSERIPMEGAIPVYKLKDAAQKHGWPVAFLSPDHRFSRIGFRWGVGLVPFNRKQRLFNPLSFLKLDKIVRVNTHVRFDSSLGEDYVFPGLTNPLARFGFPYDKFLRVTESRLTETCIFGEGNSWWVSNIVFTFMEEVSIKTDSYWFQTEAKPRSPYDFS